MPRKGVWPSVYSEQWKLRKLGEVLSPEVFNKASICTLMVFQLHTSLWSDALSWGHRMHCAMLP